jgi:hypothetical protein
MERERGRPALAQSGPKVVDALKRGSSIPIVTWHKTRSVGY